MKIGIDARLIEETGVGRYIRNLIAELSALDHLNEYVVYLMPKSFSAFELPNSRWQKREVHVRWHTLMEQIQLPGMYKKDKLDVLHVPYFTIPLFYTGAIIVTIHDLTILHFTTGKATTLPYPLYLLRLLGYRISLYFGLTKAKRILVPSEATKKEVLEHFSVQKDHVRVTYEGIDAALQPKSTTTYGNEKKQYFLYVGNAYPHKNVERMLQAFRQLYYETKRPIRLILVGKDDFFYKRLEEEYAKNELSQHVEFHHHVSDQELHDLYSNAIALVYPSFMEGFGLPPLEALSLGTKAVVSDIPVFHEILDGFPIYVDPLSVDSIKEGMKKALEDKNNSYQTKEISKWITRFSWKQMALSTLQAYEETERQ